MTTPISIEENSANNTASDQFLIVGIGASAGGVQALKEFFENVPSDSGIAYVVILHLSPDYDSQLAEVLQVIANIPVTQVTEAVRLAPDYIYVVSPNQSLTINDGSIIVSPIKTVEERRAPVDIFFRTLAESHFDRAVAVVLSGTGANGSMGIKRVKENGGATFVQNPREAQFNEMPRNAIATDLIDAVLPVGAIPARIISYKKNLGTAKIPISIEDREEDQQQALQEIFSLMRLRTGHDFSNYKRATVLRRIERRIYVSAQQNLVSYAGYLRENHQEAMALLKDLLISVTNFFRDKESFGILESEIIPRILENKHTEDQVRIWVSGCATGEEAYSLAMLFADKTMNIPGAPSVQIFATDIDEPSIAIARQGFYTLNDAADVSPEYLRRFFNKETDGYRIRQEIREMILFAEHNVLKDPPFSHLDLATCRNMLIYFNQTAQNRVMERLHFALKPGGYLFLGGSESIDGASDLFASVSKQHRIFQSREVSPKIFPLTDGSLSFRQEHARPAIISKDQENRSPLRITYAELHQQLLEQYAPPSIIVNEEYDIIHMSEHAGRFLQMPGGEPSKNLLKLAREELRLELRTALYQAVQRQTNVETKNIAFNLNDEIQNVNLIIRPVLRQTDTARGFILVIFETSNHIPQQTELVNTVNEPAARYLEEELIRIKTQLRTTTEQYETQTEELKASNEELQAMNEELRSSAEELETSKEELQSVNEELITVNQELRLKIDEITLSGNNFQNLINSTHIGTIFLDRSLSVKMFTPAARDTFNLLPADLGRPLSDITNRLEYAELISDAEIVLEKLQTIEREVETNDSRVYLVRILPYRTSEDHINGIVLTLLDITKRKDAEQKLRKSEQRLKKAIEIETVAVAFYNENEEFTDVNEAFLKMIGFTREELLAPAGKWKKETSVEKISNAIAAITRSVEVGLTLPIQKELFRKDGVAFWGLVAASKINAAETVVFIIDITQQKKLELQKDEFIGIASHELKTPVTSIKVFAEALHDRFTEAEDNASAAIIRKLNAQVMRLTKLIENLLDVTNISEGYLELKLETMDINSLINDYIQEIRDITPKHQLIFRPGMITAIKADKERIGQVMSNLISNAIKYSPAGGEVIISTEPIRGGIQVCVQDFGIGMTEALQEKVFQRFFRANQMQNNTYPGVGLGLYISAEIIRRHGGEIQVNSQDKKGSLFSFTLYTSGPNRQLK